MLSSNSSVLIFYHPMIIAVYSVGFILSIGKLLIRRWSLGLAILHFVYKAGVCLLLCFIIMNQSVFNPEFFEEIFIYREGYYKASEGKEEEDNGLTEIIIAKHRNGATGEVNLAFEKNFSRFTDLAPIGPDGSSAGVRDVRG